MDSHAIEMQPEANRKNFLRDVVGTSSKSTLYNTRKCKLNVTKTVLTQGTVPLDSSEANNLKQKKWGLL
jgi:hypothetical protein